MTPHVRILLGTWNGAPHLQAQLDSFLGQSHRNWSLVVRDDGSRDDTVTILSAFRDRHPSREVTILPGDAAPLGAAGNFLALLGWAAAQPPALIAFADQDDVWLPHKLARAVAVLGPDIAPGARPAVYASRSIHTDADLRPLGPSTLHPRPPSFANALVQNVLGGNTIVLNPAAGSLVAGTGDGVPFHDWWIYLVASGAGARIVNDAEPGLLYRQHGANVLGAHAGLAGSLGRLGTVRRGGWQEWIARNLAALDPLRDRLTPEARALLDGFRAMRAERSPFARVAALRRLGIHRQTRSGQILLQMLAFSGRL